MDSGHHQAAQSSWQEPMGPTPQLRLEQIAWEHAQYVRVQEQLLSKRLQEDYDFPVARLQRRWSCLVKNLLADHDGTELSLRVWSLWRRLVRKSAACQPSERSLRLWYELMSSWWRQPKIERRMLLVRVWGRRPAIERDWLEAQIRIAPCHQRGW